MNAKEMHYDFKQKLNEIDSEKYRGLQVPEIDWKLNEAEELFIKMIAEPRLRSQLGFETNQRTINDIRTVVIDQKPPDYISATQYDTTSYKVELPSEYWFLVKIRVIASKEDCTEILLYDSKEVQHENEVESTVFNSSSFEWRTSNYRFNKEGIRLFTDGTFTINKVGLEYIKRPRKIYNAVDWIGGTYQGLDGVTYTGTQSSELPEGVHGEVVDLAVMLTAGDLNMPNYQNKMNKVKINN